ncbi:hypothetical protein PAHAL_4G091900 [Panicum hallii]|uniref:Uncharacterized protein n=1 Tax=Panicum hallii TaxID=206008 RepID=A0A2S3HI69_9POAL|nr:hypothetical protein PAHAL_4G091900 [Panicum hallii]
MGRDLGSGCYNSLARVGSLSGSLARVGSLTAFPAPGEIFAITRLREPEIGLRWQGIETGIDLLVWHRKRLTPARSLGHSLSLLLRRAIGEPPPPPLPPLGGDGVPAGGDLLSVAPPWSVHPRCGLGDSAPPAEPRMQDPAPPPLPMAGSDRIPAGGFIPLDFEFWQALAVVPPDGAAPIVDPVPSHPLDGSTEPAPPVPVVVAAEPPGYTACDGAGVHSSSSSTGRG